MSNKLKLNNNTDSKPINIIKKQKDDEYAKACKELEKDFAEDMRNSAIEIEISSEDLEKEKKKYKSLLIKRVILYFCLIFTFIAIVGFGTYKTFFEHKYTGNEIAYLANRYNGKTNFPESGVQGYLESNIDALIKDKLSIDSSVKELYIETPIVTRINPKNDGLANVYFYTTIVSNNGKNTVNCVLPIAWNKESQIYSPAGTIMFTPNSSSNASVKEVENPLLSFEDIPKENEEKVKSSETFIDNFFSMLYAGQDISPYYKGEAKIKTEGLTYNGLTEYMLYQSTNGNGYNVSVKINLTMSNGISYITQKYLTIKRSGESWIVQAVL